MSGLVVELDDFGSNHIISDQCQSRDCRDKLDELHLLNPAFKVTLFSIPNEMTPELYDWCRKNYDWVRVGLHGDKHTSNYECEKWTEMDMNRILYSEVVELNYDRVFRAPGWQISDECYKALQDAGWIVCDQSYNDGRRPIQLPAWVNYDGVFKVVKQTPEFKNGWTSEPIPTWHGHSWDVGWNGIYEDFDRLSEMVNNATEFHFVSEVVQ